MTSLIITFNIFLPLLSILPSASLTKYLRMSDNHVYFLESASKILLLDFSTEVNSVHLLVDSMDA